MKVLYLRSNIFQGKGRCFGGVLLCLRGLRRAVRLVTLGAESYVTIVWGRGGVAAGRVRGTFFGAIPKSLNIIMGGLWVAYMYGFIFPLWTISWYCIVE